MQKLNETIADCDVVLPSLLHFRLSSLVRHNANEQWRPQVVRFVHYFDCSACHQNIEITLSWVKCGDGKAFFSTLKIITKWIIKRQIQRVIASHWTPVASATHNTVQAEYRFLSRFLTYGAQSQTIAIVWIWFECVCECGCDIIHLHPSQNLFITCVWYVFSIWMYYFGVCVRQPKTNLHIYLHHIIVEQHLALLHVCRATRVRRHGDSHIWMELTITVCIRFESGLFAFCSHWMPKHKRISIIITFKLSEVLFSVRFGFFFCLFLSLRLARFLAGGALRFPLGRIFLLSKDTHTVLFKSNAFNHLFICFRSDVANIDTTALCAVQCRCRIQTLTKLVLKNSKRSIYCFDYVYDC